MYTRSSLHSAWDSAGVRPGDTSHRHKAHTGETWLVVEEHCVHCATQQKALRSSHFACVREVQEVTGM